MRKTAAVGQNAWLSRSSRIPKLWADILDYFTACLQLCCCAHQADFLAARPARTSGTPSTVSCGKLVISVVTGRSGISPAHCITTIIHHGEACGNRDGREKQRVTKLPPAPPQKSCQPLLQVPRQQQFI